MRIGGNILNDFKLILVARTIELDIIIYYVVSIILEVTGRIKRGGNIPYIGVHLIAVSSSRYCVYTINLS